MSRALIGYEAAEYIGLKDPRTLTKLPIPRSDVRVEGAKRAQLRWQVADLDAFLEKRRVKAGHEGT